MILRNSYVGIVMVCKKPQYKKAEFDITTTEVGSVRYSKPATVIKQMEKTTISINWIPLFCNLIHHTDNCIRYNDRLPSYIILSPLNQVMVPTFKRSTPNEGDGPERSTQKQYHFIITLLWKCKESLRHEHQSSIEKRPCTYTHRHYVFSSRGS